MSDPRTTRSPDSYRLTFEACEKFPNTPNLTLARALYAKYPLVFPSVDSARTAIRSRRGGYVKYGKKASHPPTPKAQLPATAYQDPGPFTLEGSKRILVLSDLHIPYQDNAAIEAAIKYGRKRACDTVLINGDLLDMHTLSRFDKEPSAARFRDERKAGIAFLEYIYDRFPNARVILKEGNHDERLEKFVMLKAPEIWDEEIFSLDVLLQAEGRVELINDKREIKAGYLNIIHGHEVPSGIATPVNPARGLYLRAKECAMAGHWHKTSEHTENSINGRIVTCWTTGCLCGLRPRYMPNNGWNQGFASVELDGMDFSVENLRIKDGEIF